VFSEFVRSVIILLLLANTYKNRILDAFTKLWIATISFVMSVRLYAYKSPTTGRIFMKSSMYLVMENLSRKFKVGQE
jgi:hypothetical protein